MNVKERDVTKQVVCVVCSGSELPPWCHRLGSIRATPLIHWRQKRSGNSFCKGSTDNIINSDMNILINK